MNPALDAHDAAAYCGVSKTFFEAHIRPLVAVIDMKQPRAVQAMPRWLVSDLDTFLNTRRRAGHVV